MLKLETGHHHTHRTDGASCLTLLWLEEIRVPPSVHFLFDETLIEEGRHKPPQTRPRL
jgi:hypothetical protein